MKKTINGTNGLRIDLDTDEVFTDDPGQGTPAMVYFDKFSATYDCAVDTGELSCGDYILKDCQLEWLEARQNEVDEFFIKYLKG